ncbi:family 1 glycosylhydrolase [Clavibacter zhangzhiyongii]|uniref:family 1 glycosylhydrolase n=1 Tax=Clavibacter zhangzhiyongii TaxID=2768071 RepID=UPI0039E07CA9
MLSFSVSWSRVQPEARGGLRREGIGFYDELVDALLAAGIRPRAALHDHDLPVELQDRGGWLHRDTALRFGDLAYLAAEALADRVPDWVTLRTPALTTMAGHVTGTHAPGSRLGLDALPTVHHQLLAHGRAVEAIRGARSSARVGIVNAHRVVEAATAGRRRPRGRRRRARPAPGPARRRRAARPLPGPRRPARGGVRAARRVDPADLRAIGQPLDHYGVALADPIRVAAVPRLVAGSTAIPFAELPWTDHPASLDGHPVAARPRARRAGRPPRALRRRPPARRALRAGRGAPRAGGRPRRQPSGSASRARRLRPPHRRARGGRPRRAPRRACGSRRSSRGACSTASSGRPDVSAPRGLVHVDPRTRDRTPRSSYLFLRDALRARG